MGVAIEPYAHARRWQRTEYERLVDLGFFEGERLELLDGVLAVREPQGSSHAAIAAQVAVVLGAAFGPGWHARPHAPLAIGEESEPEPDVAIVAGRPRDHVDAHPSAAALILEVADSSLRLDRRVKGAIYARGGVPEYWIVNLVDRSVEVHRDPGPGADPESGWRYRLVEALRPPAVVASLGAPDARILVGDLLPGG